MKSCSDAEFIEAWERFKSAPKVAEFLKLTLRGVYSRRGNLERKYGVNLDSKIQHRPTTRLPIRKAKLEVKNGFVVIFSDCHYWPCHIPRAHTALRSILKILGKEVSAIVANGDIIDGATTSRHARLGWEKRPTLAQELDVSRGRLDELRRDAPRAARFWNLGNHDNRLDGWLANHAPEVEGLFGVTLQDQFPDWPMSMALHINEGRDSHTVIKHRWHGGTYAVRNNVLKGGLHMVTSHLHQGRVWAHDNFTGTRYAVDTGCIADIDGPQFTYIEENPRDWRSAFAVLRYVNYELLPPQLCVIQGDKAIYCNEVI